MDIQTEKIELAKLILNTDDIGLLDQVKALFKTKKDESWWNEIPESIQKGINESIAQADRGEFVSFDELKIEVSALLKK